MRILVLGGYGLIGAPIMAVLHRDGHEIVGVGRRAESARRRFPYARWIALDLAHVLEPWQWRDLVRGCDAVVSCAGALQDGPADDLEAIHVTNPDRLWQACVAEGVRRVVLVSAVGIDGTTAFARTKRRGEELLTASGLEWFILRPALVLAPVAYGGSGLLRGLAGLPIVTPIWRGDTPIQTIDVDDVARTVRHCLQQSAPTRRVFELAHPEPVALRDLVLAMRGWLGLAPQRVVALPDRPIRWLARLADAAAWAGWRSPMRTTALDQLAIGIRADPEPWMTATGIHPRSLADSLAAYPAGVQESWFARGYFLKPAGILGLAVFWIVTGLVALGPGAAAAEAMLMTAGLSTSAAGPALIASSILDILLGVLLLHRRTAGPALTGMLAVSMAYLLGRTILAPGLWLDPLGPLLKILPVMLAILAVRAILDDR